MNLGLVLPFTGIEADAQGESDYPDDRNNAVAILIYRLSSCTSELGAFDNTQGWRGDNSYSHTQMREIRMANDANLRLRHWWVEHYVCLLAVNNYYCRLRADLNMVRKRDLELSEALSTDMFEAFEITQNSYPSQTQGQ